MIHIEGCTYDQGMHTMQDGLQNKELIRTMSKSPSRMFPKMLVEA